MPITTAVSSQTFQNFDGTNFSTEGVDVKLKQGNSSIGGYIGIGTSLADSPTGMIADVKGSTRYGNSSFSGGFRLRHNINKDSKTVQLRVQPATIDIPVSKKASIYATPYIAAKLNYNTGKIKTETGIFSGINIKVGKATIFGEGQIYDLSKVNKSTIGINAGISVPL